MPIKLTPEEKTERELARKAEAEARKQRRAEENAKRLVYLEEAKKQRKLERLQKQYELQNLREARKAARESARQSYEFRNGVKKPREGTKCGLAWALFDEMYAEFAGVPETKIIIERGIAKGYNEGNLRCELTNWKTFNGHKSHRVASTKAQTGQDTTLNVQEKPLETIAGLENL